MATLFVDKVDPQSGTSLEIGSSGDTITIPSGATITNNGTQTGFGGVNTPSFKATASADQSIPNSTETIVVFDTEVYDTDNAFNNTSSGNGYSFTVPSGQAGKYLLAASTRLDGWTTPRFYISISVNGSNQIVQDIGNGGTYTVVNPVYIADLSVGDYVQCKIFHQNGSSQNVRRQETYLQGFKLIGV